MLADSRSEFVRMTHVYLCNVWSASIGGGAHGEDFAPSRVVNMVQIPSPFACRRNAHRDQHLSRVGGRVAVVSAVLSYLWHISERVDAGL